MDRDINNHVELCPDCREIAPSKLNEPLIPAPVPDYPFQNVAADLFEINGEHYLVYEDRLTGSAELAHYPSQMVSSAIINTFREFFHRWGVAEEISIHGDPNLSSKEVKTWLKSWGTSIRGSSAYYPNPMGEQKLG